MGTNVHKCVNLGSNVRKILQAANGRNACGILRNRLVWSKWGVNLVKGDRTVSKWRTQVAKFRDQSADCLGAFTRHINTRYKKSIDETRRLTWGMWPTTCLGATHKEVWGEGTEVKLNGWAMLPVRLINLAPPWMVKAPKSILRRAVTLRKGRPSLSIWLALSGWPRKDTSIQGANTPVCVTQPAQLCQEA